MQQKERCAYNNAVNAKDPKAVLLQISDKKTNGQQRL